MKLPRQRIVAGCAVALALLGGVAWWWSEQQLKAQRERVEAALQQMTNRGNTREAKRSLLEARGRLDVCAEAEKGTEAYYRSATSKKMEEHWQKANLYWIKKKGEVEGMVREAEDAYIYASWKSTHR